MGRVQVLLQWLNLVEMLLEFHQYSFSWLYIRAVNLIQLTL